MRVPLVRFLVELCRPSQLTTGPFLRGFYFSGVRPVMVTEAAPVVRAPEPAPPVDGIGATGMFQRRPAAQPAAARPHASGRARSRSGCSSAISSTTCCWPTKPPWAPARPASKPACRAASCSVPPPDCACFTAWRWMVSFAQEPRARNPRVKQAAARHRIGGIPRSERGLARLRCSAWKPCGRSLETLTNYNRDGAPWSYRWGLYVGNALYPEVRRALLRRFPQAAAAARPRPPSWIRCARCRRDSRRSGIRPHLRQPEGVPDHHLQPRQEHPRPSCPRCC